MIRPLKWTLLKWTPLKWTLGIAATVYLIVLGALTIEQRAFLFHRTTARPVLYDQSLLPRRSIVCLVTSDDVALRSWYFPPTHRGAPVILFLHGNAGDLGDHLPILTPLLNRGAGVLALEYRGYGGNPGSPSEEGLYKDARAALDFLARRKFDARRIVLFGKSLGTGIAVQMAIERDVGAIILRSPYTSIPDVAALQFPIFPARWLVRDRFDSLSKVARIKAPLLIYHGALDALVPVTLGRRLFDAAPEPKTWLEIPGVGHNDVQTVEADRAEIAFLDRVLPDRDPTPEPNSSNDLKGEPLSPCGA